MAADGVIRWSTALTVDGLIYASSMVMLDSARRRVPVPALARWLLGLGIAATLAANVAPGPIGGDSAGPGLDDRRDLALEGQQLAPRGHGTESP